MRRERKKIARLHFLSNENLFLPFSFHPARRLFNFMQGSGSGEGRGAFEFQVCFVGDSGKVGAPDRCVQSRLYLISI